MCSMPSNLGVWTSYVDKGRFQELNFGLERHQIEWKHLCCVECSWFLLWLQIKPFKLPILVHREVFQPLRSERNRFNPEKSTSGFIFKHFQVGVGNKPLQATAWCWWRAAGTGRAEKIPSLVKPSPSFQGAVGLSQTCHPPAEPWIFLPPFLLCLIWAEHFLPCCLSPWTSPGKSPLAPLDLSPPALTIPFLSPQAWVFWFFFWECLI